MTRLDRRALFTTGAAAALLAASGVSLEAAPRRGGRLRIAAPKPDSPLPAAARSAVFDTLTEVDPNGVLRGELVTAWHGCGDARVWNFELRREVTFHDGAAFGARDAAASLAHHAEVFPLNIASLDLLADHLIRIELKDGNPDLPYRLADPALVICPADDVETALSKGVGTGLYRACDIRPGRHFRGERVEKHYKDGRAGWFDSIEIVVIPDPAVRAQALCEGFVDVAELPLAESLPRTSDWLCLPSGEHIHLAVRRGVGLPRAIGQSAPLDDGRIAERWWML